MNYHMTSGLMKFAFWFLTSLGYRAVHTLFALGVMLLVFETIIVDSSSPKEASWTRV